MYFADKFRMSVLFALFSVTVLIERDIFCRYTLRAQPQSMPFGGATVPFDVCNHRKTQEEEEVETALVTTKKMTIPEEAILFFCTGPGRRTEKYQ